MAGGCSTICLPIDPPSYQALNGGPARFRGWLDAAFADCPEFFPDGFAFGYTLKDCRTSRKTGVPTRRTEPRRRGGPAGRGRCRTTSRLIARRRLDDLTGAVGKLPALLPKNGTADGRPASKTKEIDEVAFGCSPS